MSAVTASQVTSDLVRARKIDLIRSYTEHESLDRTPSRFYHTWLLVREG